MSNQSFQGTDTYLIECGRENSLINDTDDESTNGTWTTACNMNLKRGDRVSIEMVCANIKSAGTSSPAIELTGSNLTVNNKVKPYCDTKCLIEVFFYQNNNNTYSVGLPLIHPYAGINGACGTSGATIKYPNIAMPINMPEGYKSGGRTNQEINYRMPNMGFGYVKQNISLGTGAISVQLSVDSKHYNVYQYLSNTSGTWVNQLAAGDQVNGIRIGRHTDVPTVAYTGDLFTDFATGYINGFQRDNSSLSLAFQSNWEIGQLVIIILSGNDIFCCGQILNIQGGDTAGGRMEIIIDTTKGSNGGVIPAGNNTDINGGVNPYIGALEFDFNIGWEVPAFDLKDYSSGVGMVNYDNLNQDAQPTPDSGHVNFHRGHNNALFNYSDYIGEPLARQTFKTPPAVDTTIDPPLKNCQFPETLFKPRTGADAVPRSTSTAGEYGSYQSPSSGQYRPFSGYRNANIREECNNDPYIMMRQDCFGMGRRCPDGTNTPRAKPMTAFIYIDVKDLLQNIDSLCDFINDRLHETIEGLGNSSLDVDVLLNSNIQNPKGKQPSSNVVPLYNKYGVYDAGATGMVTNVEDAANPGTYFKPNVALYQIGNYKYQKIFTDVISMKYGGCSKVIPCNLSAGENFLNTAPGRSWLSNYQLGSAIRTNANVQTTVEDTYLRRIRAGYVEPTADTKEARIGNYGGWANPIYGNFGTHDMYKFMFGDCLARMPLYDNIGNKGYDRLTDTTGFYPNRIGKIVMYNNLLTYTPLVFEMPNGTIYPWYNEDTGYPSTFPAPHDTNKCVNVSCNTLFEKQIIYTNIPFPTEDTQNGDWAELAEAIRNVEQYFNTAEDAPETIEGQNLDSPNWNMTWDVGQTDDHLMCQTNVDMGQPSIGNPPPEAMIDFTFGEGDDGGNIEILQNNTPLCYDWQNNPPPSSRSDVGVSPTQQLYGTALGYSNGTGGQQPENANAKRELMSPTRTFDAFAQAGPASTFDETFFVQLRKALGRLEFKSRWDENYKTNTVNYKGTIINDTTALPPEPLDEGFREAFNPIANITPAAIDPTKWSGDTSFMENLNIGFYPYLHYPDLGGGTFSENAIVLCAIRIGVNYEPKANDLASINFAQLTWGIPLGVSCSFMDNHGIIPMNNDEIKQQDVIAISDEAGAVTRIPSDRNDSYNMCNYINVGAANPTFRYNSENGKCEFINLQQDNLLNELATPYKKKGVVNPTISAQIGQKVAILNSATGDACFGRFENDGGDRLFSTKANAGIRAELSGVGIMNIFLCGEDYVPPNNINLGAYWSNQVGDTPDNTNPLNPGRQRYSKTEQNRQRIIQGTTKATKDDWDNTLFSRLGFKNIYELLPLYGKQNNRFNRNSYNNQMPSRIGTGTKPLILCNETDNTLNPSIHTFYTRTLAIEGSVGPPIIVGKPQPVNGEPLFSQGTINNEQSIVVTNSQALTASVSPVFTTSPFLLIESNICQTNMFQGKTQNNGLFYLMKNYSSNGYIYGYGSSYSHTLNQDRLLSLVTTKFRDPTTGRLQKCSKNSTVIYKIQRDVFIPAPTTTVNGTQINQPKPNETDELLKQILNVESGLSQAGSSNITGGLKKNIKSGPGPGSRGPVNTANRNRIITSSGMPHSRGSVLGGTEIGAEEDISIAQKDAINKIFSGAVGVLIQDNPEVFFQKDVNGNWELIPNLEIGNVTANLIIDNIAINPISWQNLYDSVTGSETPSTLEISEEIVKFYDDLVQNDMVESSVDLLQSAEQLLIPRIVLNPDGFDAYTMLTTREFGDDVGSGIYNMVEKMFYEEYDDRTKFQNPDGSDNEDKRIDFLDDVNGGDLNRVFDDSFNMKVFLMSVPGDPVPGEIINTTRSPEDLISYTSSTDSEGFDTRNNQVRLYSIPVGEEETKDGDQSVTAGQPRELFGGQLQASISPFGMITVATLDGGYTQLTYSGRELSESNRLQERFDVFDEDQPGLMEPIANYAVTMGLGVVPPTQALLQQQAEQQVNEMNPFNPMSMGSVGATDFGKSVASSLTETQQGTETSSSIGPASETASSIAPSTTTTTSAGTKREEPNTYPGQGRLKPDKPDKGEKKE